MSTPSSLNPRQLRESSLQAAAAAAAKIAEAAAADSSSPVLSARIGIKPQQSTISELYRPSVSSRRPYENTRKQTIIGIGGGGSIHTSNDNPFSMKQQIPVDVAALKQKTFYQRIFYLLHERTKMIIESHSTVMLITALTAWSLFSDDIRVLWASKTGDDAFQGVSCVILVIYVFEILALSWCHEAYFIIPTIDRTTWSAAIRSFFKLGGYFFFVDCIGTLTLLIEIEWIVGVDLYSFPASMTKVGLHILNMTVRARYVRVLRAMRVIRLTKLYKYMVSYYNQVDSGSGSSGSGINHTVASQLQPALGSLLSLKMQSALPEDTHRKSRESHVGAAMTDTTNRKVIVLICILLILIPLLMIYDENTTNIISTQMINQLGALNETDSSYQSAFQLVLDQTVKMTPVLGINLQGNWYLYNGHRIHSLREEELITYNTHANDFYTKTIFDGRTDAVAAARTGILSTLLMSAILILSVHTFSRDISRLVIVPIDRMVALVQKISLNPLGVEYKVLGEEDGFVDGMETTILLTTITKIGGLMKVGFGEAGASIIARNLANGAGEKLNVMGDGTMIHSIFGFCDIRQFTDTTECLQEEVMLFVNRIAHILHGIVVQCEGTANKNVGDAFLLTWKIENPTEAAEKYLADQALLAFCKSLIEISRHQQFICDFSVSATSRLLTRFTSYKIRMGCGLHVGWAIEGAIGSNRKIDASYLSPHVSFTEYLESSTKKYGVPMVLSEPFYKMLSPEVKRFCREIDRIRRKEEPDSIGLFAYDADVDINWDSVDHKRKIRAVRSHGLVRRPSKKFAVNSVRRAQEGGPRHRALSDDLSPVKRERGLPVAVDLENSDGQEKQSIDAPLIIIPPYHVNVWKEDEDLVEQRRHVNDLFREKWATGYTAFINGNWIFARRILEETLGLLQFQRESDYRGSRVASKDGPSYNLLVYMEDHGWEAPLDWCGVSCIDV